MARVLLLGGDGMLGSMMRDVLGRSPDIELVVTSRRPRARVFVDAEQGLESLDRLAGKCHRCDYAVNCIGVLRAAIRESEPRSVERALRVNALFPILLARVAERDDMRVIHVSTDAVFSDAAGVCYEDTPADAAHAYGKSKYLGEVHASFVLNLRCSIIGPDPSRHAGLLEWFLGRRAGERVPGFVDQLWNGVTTLQLARLCRRIIERGAFEAIRREAPVHHVCPNETVTKAQLLGILGEVFGVRATIEPASAPHGPVTRVLATRHESVRALTGEGIAMRHAVEELAAVTRASHAGR